MRLVGWTKVVQRHPKSFQLRCRSGTDGGNMHIDATTLATIQIPSSAATLDAILGRFGLRTSSTESSNEFDIVSDGRNDEPEVSLDLLALSLNAMSRAQQDGALPSWKLVARKS